MTKLFHATTNDLAIGETLIVRPQDAPSHRQAAEEFLEQHRPQTISSRTSSWFAFAKAGYAARFFEAEMTYKGRRSGTPRLYAVEIPSATKHPMVIANAVNTKISAGETGIAAILAQEYWMPTKDWRFWEYIGHEMKVLEQLDWPENIEQSIALQTYSADTKLLNELLTASENAKNV